MKLDDSRRSDNVERLRQANQAGQACGTAPRWNEADLRFGQADARGFFRGRDAPIASERNFKTAADARAVNGGDGHQRQRGDAIEHGLAEFN